MQSKKVVLLNRPVGALKETYMGVFDETLAPLEPGEVLLEIEHLSVDAFIRTTFDEGALPGPNEGTGTTNFDTVAIQRIGANVQFVRPLNGGNP